MIEIGDKVRVLTHDDDGRASDDFFGQVGVVTETRDYGNEVHVRFASGRGCFGRKDEFAKVRSRKLQVVLLLCAALAGCGGVIMPGDYEAAAKACEPHGGVRWVETSRTMRETSGPWSWTLSVKCASGTYMELPRRGP